MTRRTQPLLSGKRGRLFFRSGSSSRSTFPGTLPATDLCVELLISMILGT